MHTTYYILVVLVAVVQDFFLTGVLNLTLSVRKLSWPYTQCFLLHIAAEPFNGSADIAAAASTAAVTAFLEHIITEAVYGQESFRTLTVYGQESFRTLTVYGQESFRTLLCTIKRSLFSICQSYSLQFHRIDFSNSKNQVKIQCFSSLPKEFSPIFVLSTITRPVEEEEHSYSSTHLRWQLFVRLWKRLLPCWQTNNPLTNQSPNMAISI